ncbi:hypothetical protein RvY_11715 [Ramazzottius varieornatus]|uniref:Uncharacterized protein n=1 Tax=Ramazzottius varieornatus TaxID=947166 RepID=A0A1D1VLC9_RAMVA|nr:hypothetical protein RvY_11715 [Ramazzottius varieornatus]
MSVWMRLVTVILWIVFGTAIGYDKQPCNDMQVDTALRTWHPKLRLQAPMRRYRPDNRNEISIGPHRGCFPNVLRNPVMANLLKKLETYHVYRYLPESTTNPVQIYNAELIYSFVPKGTVYLPDSHIHAVHCVRKYNAIEHTEAGYPRCITEDNDILSTPAGVDYHLTFDNDYVAPVHKVWYHLYDDSSPDGLEIMYACIEANFLTGFCLKPEIVVNTRAHPGSMSYHGKRQIDKLIDQVLLPFCMKSHDLLPVIFRPEYQTCDAPADPTFVKLVRGLTKSLHQRRPSRNERIPIPTYDLLTGRVVPSRRTNELSGVSHERKPYTFAGHPVRNGTYGRSRGSSSHQPSKDDPTPSRNDTASAGGYRITYYPLDVAKNYPSDNQTLHGLEKIPNSYRPPNGDADNDLDGELLHNFNEEPKSNYPSMDLEDFLRDNSALRGLKKIPSASHPPKSIQYDNHVNKTFHNPDEVPGSSFLPEGTAYNSAQDPQNSRRSNETLHGLNKMPEPGDSVEKSVSRYDNISDLSGLSKLPAPYHLPNNQKDDEDADMDNDDLAVSPKSDNSS